MKHIIRLSQPASSWEESLPIGNGRLGALIRGIPGDETIHLNEETIWYGGPNERLGPDASDYVQKTRDLLDQGEVEEANYLGRVGLFSAPKYLSPFQPAGELRLNFRNHQGEAKNYQAVLNIDDSVATVEYNIEDVQWKKEHLASRRDNVIAIRITNSMNDISMSANLLRRPFEEFSQAVTSDTTGLWGTLGVGGLSYFGGLSATIKGGVLKTINDYIIIENAAEVIIYVSFETNFQKNTLFRENVLRRLGSAKAKTFDTILKEHLQDYHSLYQRMKFSLEVPDKEIVSTADEIQKAKEGNGDYRMLSETLFHFGRYLMISGSTDCVLPLTLQGIWNGSYTPRWESKYTININIQMNYWAAGLCQLSECHLPLFDLLDRMLERGKKTAKQLYDCNGFVAHHNTSIWADTDPEGIFGPSPIWPMGGAWLAIHLFDYYDYTGDLDFLEKRALPIIEESVIFLSDYMVRNKDNYLVTGPSLSPENTYITEDGQTGSICMGPTMDVQIVRQLLESYIAASDVLKLKKNTYDTACFMLEQLPPTRLTADGRIAEWQEDYKEEELGHRHISHLFGLYPGSQITAETPELMEGARKTIETRLQHGGAHTGWSRAWIISMFARLKEGDEAYFHIREMFGHSIMSNLFNSHPPYQIDGNFGFTAGVVEMIVQSHGKLIEILPALPIDWPNGRMMGIGLRGAMTADIVWKDGTLEECILISLREDKEVTVKYKGTQKRIQINKGIPTNVVAILKGSIPLSNI